MSKTALALGLLTLAIVPAWVAPPPNPPLFEDVTERAGLRFAHFNGMSGRFHMVENIGSGCALFDYDDDGDLDLYLVQGGSLDGTEPDGGADGLSDRLYRNTLARPGSTATLRFEDVTKGAGLGRGGYGMGAATADFDNDGRIDLYVTAWGRNRLLRNLGGGRFADVTEKSRTQDLGWSVPAVFFDYDRDGWLDLYVGNYVQYDPNTERECKTVAGARDYCNPAAYPAAPDRLLHNRGDGTFENVSRKAGFSGSFGRALGAVSADFNNDGWPDLYVANDGGPNQLWVNRGDGTFSDEGLLAGCAVNELGISEASMGVEAADFDGDGDIDLFLSHLTGETNTYYVNEGGGTFVDATQAAGLGSPSRWATGFGAGAIDYDSDGWLDLLIVNGAVRTLEDLAQKRDPYPFRQPNQLFHNLGSGRFTEATSQAGQALKESEVSRGAAFGDLDNDGDTDVLISNNHGSARLLLNRANPTNWIGLRFLGGLSDGLGGVATLLRSDGRRLVRRVHSDGSFASASDPRILFGLGSAGLVKVSVAWTDGSVQEWRDLPLRQYTTLKKGGAAPR